MKYYIGYVHNDNDETSHFQISESEPEEQVTFFECGESEDIFSCAMSALIEIIGSVCNCDIYI